MKKIIVVFSVVLMAGCAFALADDNSANVPSNPGISGSDANTSSQTTETTTTQHKDQAMRSAKTCVDSNGNTLKKGDVGFHDCMKDHMSKEQGGTASDSNMNN